MFGNPKGALVEQEFDSTEQFLLTIKYITDFIGRAEFESVLGAWEHRWSECIQMKYELIT
jgi:hypothetical protein